MAIRQRDPLPAPPTRPCPSCGSEPFLWDRGGYLEAHCGHACEGPNTPSREADSPEALVAAWNVYASHRFMREQPMGRGVYPGPIR